MSIYRTVRGIAGAMALCASAMAFVGCADDVPENPLRPALLTGVIINVPSAEAGGATGFSRAAEEDMTAAEGKINSLQFFAFPQGNGERVYTTLDTSNPLQSTAYNQYSVELKPGDYHIYLVGNYDNIPNPSTITESELQDHYISHDMNYNPKIEAERGLPMSCRTTDIKESADGNYLTGTVVVESGQAKSLYCDMSFTVAKVRVNVLYDKAYESQVEILEAAEVSGRSKLIESAADVDNELLAGALDLTAAGGYHQLPEITGDGVPEIKELIKGASEASDKKRWHYQAVFYLPERKLKDAAEQTQLNLKVGNLTRSIFLGGEPGENGSLPENPKELLRGHLYDYVLTPAGELTLAVNNWSVETLSASLDSSIQLSVEKTRIGFGGDTGNLLMGGDVVTDYYYSNVNVDFESSTFHYGEDDIPVFLMEKCKEGLKTYVKISLNPMMPALVRGSNISAANEFYNNPSKYHYIYAKAGSLYKKIEINPDLSPYLTVTPPIIDIKVKDLRSGTNDSREISYRYSTNLPRLTCDVSYTYQVQNYAAADYAPGFPGEKEMKLKSNYQLGNAGDEEEFDRSRDKHSIILSDPTDIELYNKETIIRFIYTATDGKITLTATTYLHIYPHNGGYTLHFRSFDDSWDNVHVYVYEPLSYMCYENGHNGLEEWVMCHTENNMYENAVRHSYTGKLTFSGWMAYLGSHGNQLSQNHSGINYRFNGVNNEFYFDNDGYDANVYNEDVDYIAAHRNQIVCAACKANIERKWPGVAMIRETGENTGWWKLTLPEMCLPGKTLIMFCNGHGVSGQEDYLNRYPLHLRPGVPLYDYQDREGWFIYDKKEKTNSEFADDKPEIVRFKSGDVLRFIWTPAKNHNYIYIHVWTDKNTYTVLNASGSKGTSMSNGRYYKEITLNENNLASVNYMLYSGSNKTGEKVFSAFDALKVSQNKYELQIPDNL